MRILSQVGRVVAGVLAVLILAMAVTALPYGFRAARGEGTHGKFTAERQECSKRGCAHYGTWRANPPSDQVVTDALMDEWPADLPLGASLDARYLGEIDPAVVYPAGGSFVWLYMLVVAGFAILLVLGARVAVGEFRDDRRQARQSGGYEPRRVQIEPLSDDALP